MQNYKKYEHYLTRISHRYCREIAQMGMDIRKATEETGDVLLVRWRYPTELPERGRSQSGPDAVDMPISAIAANICEKCGLKASIDILMEMPMAIGRWPRQSV